jgi:hypothetical protein
MTALAVLLVIAGVGAGWFIFSLDLSMEEMDN